MIVLHIAQRVAKEIAHLDVPVFLYGFAAVREPRRLLSALRKGEYEGLESRFANNSPLHGDDTRLPDLGSPLLGMNLPKEWGDNHRSKRYLVGIQCKHR